MYRFAFKRLLMEWFKNCWIVFVWLKSDNKQATYENNSKGPSFRNSFILGQRSGVFILRMALSIASAVILHFSFRSRSRFWFVSRPKINNKMKCSRPSRGSWSEGKAISWWMNERLFILLLYFDGFSHPFNFGHMFIASPPGGTWIRFHWNHSTWICFEWKNISPAEQKANEGRLFFFIFATTRRRTSAWPWPRVAQRPTRLFVTRCRFILFCFGN